jgi:formate dehydrogenase major subunit
VDRLTEEYPFRLTTGRRLDDFNTGVQTSGYRSPLRREESLDISPEDARKLGVREGEIVRVSSRRGAVEVPVRVDEGLRPGLTFMTLHFADDVATNLLTIDATDPKSGTAEDPPPVSVRAAVVSFVRSTAGSACVGGRW